MRIQRGCPRGRIAMCCCSTGHRSSPAIYLETLEVSKRIKMCGQMKFNLMISATSAHFWPLKDRENCDALAALLTLLLLRRLCQSTSINEILRSSRSQLCFN